MEAETFPFGRGQILGVANMGDDVQTSGNGNFPGNVDVDLLDLAWGKAETISEKKPQSFDPHEDEYGRKKPFQNEKAFSYEKDFSEDGEISRADGVIIMPDPGSRLYLDDGSSCRDRQKKGASEDFPVQRVSSVPAAVPEDLPSGENGTQKKKEKKKSKKKDGKKKKK